MIVIQCAYYPVIWFWWANAISYAWSNHMALIWATLNHTIRLDCLFKWLLLMAVIVQIVHSFLVSIRFLRHVYYFRNTCFFAFKPREFRLFLYEIRCFISINLEKVHNSFSLNFPPSLSSGKMRNWPKQE